MNKTIIELFDEVREKYPEITLKVEYNIIEIKYSTLLLLKSEGKDSIEYGRIFLSGLLTGINLNNARKTN